MRHIGNFAESLEGDITIEGRGTAEEEEESVALDTLGA